MFLEARNLYTNVKNIFCMTKIYLLHCFNTVFSNIKILENLVLKGSLHKKSNNLPNVSKLHYLEQRYKINFISYM